MFSHSLSFQPPVNLENVTTEGLTPDIHVAGDIIAKKYDFMMGNIERNPYKIAQVVRKIKLLMANDTYFLEIGPGVDIPFIVMSAFAIDELFSDNK